jgi:diguanylate cyclase (GGDEF)-like protein
MFATRVANPLNPASLSNSQSGLLVCIYPPHDIGQPIAIEDNSIIIGRDETNQVRLNDDSVSRRHATIEWNGKGHQLTDLSSTNGTFVNEHRIHETLLRSGDRIRFGNQIFKYLSSDEVESQYHEVIFKMMTTDGLTQVYNKRFFLDSLDRELSQSEREGTSLCVCLMDLDHFKSVNDTFGHLAGDAVLSEFARRASSVVGSGQIFARFGGEEFALLCSRANLPEAVMTAERIREVTQASPVVFGDLSIPITVSIGVAALDPCNPSNAQSLLHTADQWLYTAKSSGRNQIQFER